MNLLSLLKHPLAVGRDIDDPETTLLRRDIIWNKPFLKRIYEEWYALLADAIAEPRLGPALELGSGAGALDAYISRLITSDILYLPTVQVVLDGLALPFKDATLQGILATNVFHHMSRPKQFLHEAARCLIPNGVIAMIEPWVSSWSRQIYGHLHDESFDPSVQEWEFPVGGPLSAANGALSWIVFQRDRDRFEALFPQLKIKSISPIMPFRYLLSGGVTMRSFMPGWSFSFWTRVETLFHGQMNDLAMFACIVIERTE